MSDLLRMTGMYSGMDTESVIQQLVKAKATKVTNLKNDQKKLDWKIAKWQDLNKRIYKLYTGSLSNMRLVGSYAKKKTTVSDPTKATIAASEGAVNGTQTLKVEKLAKSGYLTGAALSRKELSEVSVYDKDSTTDGSETKLSDLGIASGRLFIKSKSDASSDDFDVSVFDVEVDENDTIADFVAKFNAAGNGSQYSMEYKEGKLVVTGPNDGSVYGMTANGTGTGGKKTIMQGLGLADSGFTTGDGGVQGVREGDEIKKYAATYTKGNFKLAKTGDSKIDSQYSFMMGDISSDLVGKKLKLTVGTGSDAKETVIEITADMQISDFVNKLAEGGVNASFDETNQRFFISSAKTGAANEFKLEGLDENDDPYGTMLIDLGLQENHQYENGSESTRIKASDAEIVLNGARFTSDKNTFTVNGLSITANAVTDEEISITTDTDYDGIYDMIKDFITEYNDIMNEMTKLYSADSARKYNMLSDEEKEAMSDDEVEQWEDTIKGALLRRDNDLYTVMQSMMGAVNKGYDIGGETLYLVNFGIGTGSYFDTEKAERNALHIFGDSDDEKYSDEKNKLKAAIAENPEQLIELFTTMSKEMYSNLQKTMAATDYRSIYKVYDDKRLKTEYDDYAKRIKEEQQKLDDYEDKWYKKFSAMEVALSKLQSSQNSLASMLGQ